MMRLEQRILKVAQKDLPVVESVINDGQEALANLDKFFARQDQTLKMLRDDKK